MNLNILCYHCNMERVLLYEMKQEDRATRTARKTYNRISPIYDFMVGLVERSRYSIWREILWSKVEGTKILEVGVGTGTGYCYFDCLCRSIHLSV